MIVEKAHDIKGVVLGEVDRHSDERGFFSEIFRESLFERRFVQANHSRSQAGVLRGLHFHRRQSDAWYVVGGEAEVGLADLRDGIESPLVTTIRLVAEQPTVLLIPPGVAHGFAALTDVDLIYWVTDYYDATDEFSIRWDDPVLAVPWSVNNPRLSQRDSTAPFLTEAPRTS